MTSRRKTTKPYLVGNLKWLDEQSKLTLDPRYQRGSVWTRSQKQLLIDSLLQGIDIPKLYFRELIRQDNESAEFEVVDGQQRLRAIFEYMDDIYPMPRDADSAFGFAIAGRRWTDLDIDVQMHLRNVPLDIVELSVDYTDDDIEEIFLRLQNGTPLNAPEKRRAIAGNMRNVVADLANHRVFGLCEFQDRRFAYEDAVAKILHMLLFGNITDIRPTSLKRTYESNRDLTVESKEPRRLLRAFNFISQAFRGQPNPSLKKYAVITLGYLVVEMLDEFDLSQHGAEFADCYLDFHARRVANEELPEAQQDSALAAYTDAARSDSIPDMKYRHEFLKAVFIEKIPTLALKDPVRSFTDEQRLAIFRLGGGICVMCEAPCDESDFHADHVVPHSRGGATTVENGQILCSMHNLQKGAG